MVTCCALKKQDGEQCTRKAKFTTDEGLIVCKNHIEFKIEYIDIITKIHIEKKERFKLKQENEQKNKELLKQHLNEIPIRNKHGLITNFAKVSPEDYDEVMKHKWHKIDSYAKTKIDNKDILMHQFILGKSYDGTVIDHHTDHDGLNNTRENLRYTTRSGNTQNIKKKEGTTSKYLGVFFNNKKWIVKSSGIHLGCFTDEIEAAKKYDTYVMLKYGKDAATNKLIEYEDIKNIDIDSLIVKQTPKIMKNITKTGNRYCTEIKYKKQKFIAYMSTIEKAIEKLEEFKKEIQIIKDTESAEHLKTPITRNIDGKAVLIVKNKEGEIIGQAIVNDDKWHELSKYTWQKLGDYYLATINGKLTYLNRYLMNAKPGEIADHINDHDDNVLDNSLKNLRINDASGNSHNRIKTKDSMSSYKGVTYDKTRLKWVSQICKDTKHYNLGRYDLSSLYF